MSHILLIPSWYATDKNLVRGVFFDVQAEALLKQGNKVGLLVPPTKLRSWHGLAEVRQYWRSDPAELLIKADLPVPLYRMRWWGWRASLLPWLRGGLILPAFDQYCREQGTPDVIHGHSVLYGGYLAAYIGKKRNIPVVLTEHSTNFINRYILPGQGHFVRYALRNSSKILAVGATLAQYIRAFAPEHQIEIVPNTINTDFFAPGDELLPRSPFLITSIGSLIRRKGYHILLHAFAATLKNDQVELNIIGAGKTENELRALVANLGITHQVHFLGRLDNSGVRDVMQKSHVIVSASFVETFGVTLIEAMACGKPVIATRSGGPESFVTDQTGILIPPGDVPALAQALQEMRENYSRFDPQYIRQYCVENFSEQVVAQQLQAIYHDLMK